MVRRKCDRCGESGLLSRYEAERVHRSRSTIRVRFEHRPEATHGCEKCGALFTYGR